MQPPVTAIVVGGELNGLGVVRSLARANVPVIVVDSSASNAALWSRHARTHRVDSFEGRAFADDLAGLAKSLGHRPVLLLTDEFAVHSVSQHRDMLAPHLRFRLPPDATVKLLSDKALFHEFAAKNGFCVPNTAVLDTVKDLERLRGLRYPAVVKPTDKRRVLTGAAERALRVGNPGEAIEAARRMLRQPGAIVVQEWIEGPESNIYFTLFYRGGAVPATLFTGQKLLCFPRDVGSTAVCIAAPQARAELEATTMAFADRVGFDGFGSMEYKWDDARKAFFMIEPTVGRTDWQEEIATLCGVNIPLAAYRHETGLPPEPVRVPDASVAWRSSMAQRPPAHLLPLNARMHDGYFRWGDPKPALAYYGLGGAPRRLFERCVNRKNARPQMAKQ